MQGSRITPTGQRFAPTVGFIRYGTFKIFEYGLRSGLTAVREYHHM
jgi:hypothetical protein